MVEIINIDSFRCTNHSASRPTLASGRFDAYNPCSWCENRKIKGKSGSIFHYVEYGHWEFPFIAEANCQNFSLFNLQAHRNLHGGVLLSRPFQTPKQAIA